jgi:hypothetical protein
VAVGLAFLLPSVFTLCPCQIILARCCHHLLVLARSRRVETAPGGLFEA